MSQKSEKCVFVIDQELPMGLIANTSAIMGITLGMIYPEVVGKSVTDKGGREHLGIIEFPVPILKCSKEEVKVIREKLYDESFSDVICIDFSDVAQGCKTYDEYIEKMLNMHSEELQYLGICICGPKKKVNKLTGAMPLLR